MQHNFTLTQSCKLYILFLFLFFTFSCLFSYLETHTPLKLLIHWSVIFKMLSSHKGIFFKQTLLPLYIPVYNHGTPRWHTKMAHQEPFAFHQKSIHSFKQWHRQKAQGKYKISQNLTREDIFITKFTNITALDKINFEFMDDLTVTSDGIINVPSIYNLAPEQLITVRGQVANISAVKLVAASQIKLTKQELLIRDHSMHKGGPVGKPC